MKTILTLLFVGAFSILGSTQSAQEIVDNYFEAIGGKEAWRKVSSMKMDMKLSMQGMELSGKRYSAKPNKQLIEIDLNGKQIIQAFDGETAWSINPFAGGAAPQKMNDEEAKEFTESEFEDELLDFEKKGSKISLEGSEEVQGAMCSIIKLEKKDGSVKLYYFDNEVFVPVMVKEEIKAGPMKGQMSEAYMSEYTEVDGLIMALEMENKFGGQTAQKITLSNVEINPAIEDSKFKFPN